MIPKIIIQTYKSKDQIPADIQPFIQRIQKYNPDFTYMFFDDADIDQFVKDKFPEYLDKFNSFTPFNISNAVFYK
jgi:mannosyltransferase OCH1-like enzyme